MARLNVVPIWIACLLFLPATIQSPVAHAAVSGTSGPSIAITNLHNGSVVTGSSVTVNVSVSNFKLVPPIYINPPRITGNKGHIHYVLDSLANFKPTRDATVSLSHTWSGVSPGKHTVIAYLATSQHGRFPGAKEASASISVVAHAQQTQGAGVQAAPKTGGAADVSPSPVNPALIALAMLCVALGALFIRGVRREAGR